MAGHFGFVGLIGPNPLTHRYQLRVRNIAEYVVDGSVGADKRRAQHLRSLDALRRRCEEHLLALAVICPGLPEAATTRSQNPTLQPLYLPSHFSQLERSSYGLAKLAKKEEELRVGNAHDHLTALKDALGLKRLLLETK